MSSAEGKADSDGVWERAGGGEARRRGSVVATIGVPRMEMLSLTWSCVLYVYVCMHACACREYVYVCLRGQRTHTYIHTHTHNTTTHICRQVNQFARGEFEEEGAVELGFAVDQRPRGQVLRAWYCPC